jgi:hypothetical protein
MRHNITVDHIASGYRVSGAIAFECAAAPIVNAAAKMIEDGVATLDDTLNVMWPQGEPFNVKLSAMARYKKSSARRGMERVGFYFNGVE